MPSYTDFQQNIELDNSDTFWLVFADYCDENEVAHDIREQVSESHLESWYYEWPNQGGSWTGDRVGSYGGDNRVGGVALDTVGSDFIGEVGGKGGWSVGSDFVSANVGTGSF